MITHLLKLASEWVLGFPAILLNSLYSTFCEQPLTQQSKATLPVVATEDLHAQQVLLPGTGRTKGWSTQSKHTALLKARHALMTEIAELLLPMNPKGMEAEK